MDILRGRRGLIEKIVSRLCVDWWTVREGKERNGRAGSVVFNPVPNRGDRGKKRGKKRGSKMGRKKILVWRPYASLGAIARSRKPDVWFALFSLSNTHTKPPKNEEKILSQDSVFVVTPPLDVLYMDKINRYNNENKHSHFTVMITPIYPNTPTSTNPNN